MYPNRTTEPERQLKTVRQVIRRFASAGDRQGLLDLVGVMDKGRDWSAMPTADIEAALLKLVMKLYEREKDKQTITFTLILGKKTTSLTDLARSATGR